MTIKWYNDKRIVLFSLLFFTLYTIPLDLSLHNPSDIDNESINNLQLSNSLENEYCECAFCSDIQAHKNTKRTTMAPKDWTVIVYMAADNDLRPFAARNLNQMAAVGSNDLFNLVIHLDIKVAGDKKITRRYYIEKNKIIHINVNDPLTQKMDSGDPQTLYSCCEWAIQNYPAKNYSLIFWNHGTGALDPIRGRIIHPLEFFVFNPITNRYDLDRSVGFFDTIEPARRGICWDDSTGNYLNNSTLKRVMRDIKTNLLQGGNFAIVGFDACLMSMIEVASIIKESADIMIASQEVELGTGWNYTSVLAPFVTQKNRIYPVDLASHIVWTYKDTYASITNDYACSALDLNKISRLEYNISFVSNLLTVCLSYQKENSVLNAIRTSRSRLMCTHFDEPSYIDLHHFYTNLRNNLKYFSFKNNVDASMLVDELATALEEGCNMILQATLANVTGKNLSKAEGISIYFPEKKMHPSYQVAPFAQTNDWVNFLTNYLNL